MHLAAAPQLVMFALTNFSAVGAAGPGWAASPMRRIHSCCQCGPRARARSPPSVRAAREQAA
eukprot:463374-Lingulodinium_polyedra.AAC.1